MKRSQIGVELIFVIGFVIVVFIILLGFTMNRKHDISETEIFLKEKEECYKLSNMISGVHTSGIGTGIIMDLKYDAEIDTGEGSIFVGEEKFFCTFPISAVTTDPIESNFNLNKGSITINNTNGTVVIKNA